MVNIRHYFQALLKMINPSDERIEDASRLPGEVRDWLKSHDFETNSPHTRLSGSYARHTAILDIKDVDVLLFLPESQMDRTPNAVLLEVKKILEDYPEATADVSSQRRSVHLKFDDPDLHLDIVPAVAESGLREPLKVPDRSSKEWIDSDPLGYAKRLSSVNKDNGAKVVPLVKMFKVWRDAQMKARRPKSYVMEVMLLYAVEGEHITLEGCGYPQILADFFAYISGKYDHLMEKGTESPRIKDPMIPEHFITKGWERSHFETFMRRIREAEKDSKKAVESDDNEEFLACWGRIFGEFWPSADEAKEAAELEAKAIQPGTSRIASSGAVIGTPNVVLPTKSTKYHGDPR